MRVSDTLGFMRGRWHLERTLVDHRSRTTGLFTGSAVVESVTSDQHPGPPGAPRYPEHNDRQHDYREQGELRFGAHTGPATRRLVLLPGPDGTADVRFADGRPFYLLDLRSGQWRAEHLCGEDRYEVTHLVLTADVMEERWRVLGPDKDYESITQLARC
jgi:Family of unknown function (DUF6314)